MTAPSKSMRKLPKRKFDNGDAVDILTRKGGYFSTGIIEKWQWSSKPYEIGDPEFAYYVVSLDGRNQIWVYESGLQHAANPNID